MITLVSYLIQTIVLGLILTFPLCWCWNEMITDFGFQAVGFWQMFVLFVLIKIISNILDYCN